jgi:hypothetical protein
MPRVIAESPISGTGEANRFHRPGEGYADLDPRAKATNINRLGLRSICCGHAANGLRMGK